MTRIHEFVFPKAARSPAFTDLLEQMQAPTYVRDEAAMKKDLVENISQYRRIANEYGLVQP